MTEQPAAGVRTEERPPDFFIVGAPKSGTTALYEMLRSHPGVFMPELKEPMFFATDLRRRFQAPAAGPLPTTMAEYLALFDGAGPDQVIGEASTLYLYSETAAAEIARCNPEARVVAIFREPVAFLRSWHLQLRQNHIENQKDILRAIALEGPRSHGRRIPRRSYRPQVLRYTDHVRYTDQLQRFHDAFGRDQVLMLLYDDYRNDNASVTRRVLEFLGVDDSIVIAPTEANPTIAVRSQALDDLVHRFSVGRGPVSRAVKEAVKAVVPEPARRRLLHRTQSQVVFRRPSPLDPATEAELRRLVAPEVHRFADYTGLDLASRWGYARS